MKSPFPGMDPYLEARWPEVHASLIVYARNRINAQLPDDLQANIEENLRVLSDENPGNVRPDINVREDEFVSDAVRPVSTATIAEPLILRRPPIPGRHIEITSRDGRVITAIEILSPWNKIGNRAQAIYLHKQIDFLAADINLVEIDLVRQGDPVVNAPLNDLPDDVLTPYMICVTRNTMPNDVELYRAPINRPLPNIPVPLRPGEADVVLELQPMLDDCYRDGRYHRISYQQDPPVSFSEKDAAWIDQRLRETGRRV